MVRKPKRASIRVAVRPALPAGREDDARAGQTIERVSIQAEQFAQHHAGVFTQFRRRRADAPGSFRQLDRISGDVVRPCHGTIDCRKHRANCRLGVIYDFRKGPHGGTGYAHRGEALNPFLHIAIPENRGQDLFQRAAVLDAQGVRSVIRVRLEVAASNRAAERGPKLLAADRYGETAVPGFKDAIWHDRREPAAERTGRLAGAQKRHVIRGHRRDHSVEHGHIDILAPAAHFARAQGHHDPDDREQAGIDIGHRVPAADQFAGLGSSDAHESARALHDQVHGGFVPRRAGLPVPGYGTVDQPGIAPRRHVESEPQAIHCSGPEVLHQHVHPVDEA